MIKIINNQNCNIINGSSLKITRGSTSTLCFTFDRDVATIDTMYLTIAQDKKVVEKTKDDAEIDGKSVTFILSQEETLGFIAKRPVKMQVRYRSGDFVPPTPIFTVDVCDVLKEDVI